MSHYWVKEEGRTGFYEGWQGCSEGFPEGEARGKYQRGALPARGFRIGPPKICRQFCIGLP